MLEFEWDDAKAERNLRKHGITFEAASASFDDIFFVETKTEVHADGELRRTSVAMVGVDLIAVTYVERRNRIRIISARRATRHEETLYARNRPQ